MQNTRSIAFFTNSWNYSHSNIVNSDFRHILVFILYLENCLRYFQEAIYKYNKRQKDCLWKQRTHYGLENESLGFIETLHKQ